MATDGPAALRRLADDYEFTLNSEETPIATFDDVNVIKTAADTWDSERNQAAADRAALELARALLPDSLYKCVWSWSGYERCGCADVDKDNHCMYCLCPPWAHELAKALGGAR